jgi:hypothetical protein
VKKTNRVQFDLNVKNKKEIFNIFADHYGWDFVSSDKINGRLTYECDILKIDIYPSKMSIMLVYEGKDYFWIKNQTVNSIEEIFNNPYIYYNENKRLKIR